MPLSVIDLYRKVLPKTNCGECGFSTCLAFASMVVSEKFPLENCPYLDPETLARTKRELEEQYASGKWVRKDLASDALQWAKTRAASMTIEDLPERIGGRVREEGNERFLELPYFTGTILVTEKTISLEDGTALNRWEQVFVYNHMAQGGKSLPSGKWKGLEEIPNTVSKLKSMKEHVEDPLRERFRGKPDELREAALTLGARDVKDENPGADAALLFRPLPRIPVLLLFWDEEGGEGFQAGVKLLFDETIAEHLDVESILFLSERLKQLLCGE